MVRQTNPRKEQQKNQNESKDIPLRAKRKEQKEKYLHQNNWLVEEGFEDDFENEIDLFAVDEDFNFEDELDSDFLDEYNEEF